jgi:hypothetical protein
MAEQKELTGHLSVHSACVPTRPFPTPCRGFLMSQAIFICFHFPVMSTLHILIFFGFLNRILRY